MATNGTAPASKPESKPESKPGRPTGGKKPIKDETLAQVAGAVIAGGIVWSLFKSVTVRWNRRPVHTQGHTTEKSDSFSKDVDHASKELKHKAKDAAHDHKGNDSKHTLETAGNKISHFGHKKSDGISIQVFEGDTLWSIAKKNNVSVDALMASNGIRNGDILSAGASLILPK